ncbi:MAG: adenylosuccinate synthetase [Faecalibacterium sp.]|nr:adenylosuccinate synthetase [Faecalibacterium sp.]MDY4157110.1 adenylosuccinate synthetase [Faecalibacterium sp.]
MLPSGILHPDVTCVLGAGMVIDLDHLAGEMDAIEQRGIRVGPENHHARPPWKNHSGRAFCV